VDQIGSGLARISYFCKRNLVYKLNNNDVKIGILGGGQLGRMLQEQGLEYGIDLYFMDGDPKASCAIFNNYKLGSFKSKEDIIAFGRDKNIVTIEIEHINTEALEDLDRAKVEIVPSVASIKMIKNKAFQKTFYLENNIPTSEFLIVETDKLDEKEVLSWFPLVQKSQTEGYDGKGVVVINDVNDIHKQLRVPSIIEKKVEIKKELAITIAIESNGNVKLFPICEMVFNPELNLVDYVIAPALISVEIEKKVKKIALQLAKCLKTRGIFSIELFLDQKDKVLVNEIAPRAHNSAHYTIEGTNISQFEAQLRILLDLPLPEIHLISPSGMLNLIGEENHQGKPEYKNIEKLADVGQAHIHLYGKRETKPGRKMGHITVLNTDRNKLIEELNYLKAHINVISNEK
jgi:5-(carboxyamino)imidazole ribonucleotide synthase